MGAAVLRRRPVEAAEAVITRTAFAGSSISFTNDDQAAST
jgi:hypothetical protein